MKNKKYRISVVCILAFLALLLIIVFVQTRTSGTEPQKRVTQNTSKEIYAVGHNGEILQTEFDQAKQFFIRSGISEQDAELQAKEYVFEREALFQDAIKHGYTVTDDEIWAYLDELKQFIETADNKEDVEKAIQQFENEDAYWQFEFEVYKKDLPIQKYVESLEKEFKENQSLSGDADVENSWSEHFENLKEDLADAENFKLTE
ncbi:hypothetical protein [Lachnoclostridium sp. An181]|uniref:hypothetical protein n=1 Tax=Lachnoclostridium sp. An181 TaxID=1965575 RepID=UPI000B36A6CE|nr:hypothetical protein [Lachnoclostridium sp. An181]OUP50383.1 hypothetical protein B5F18_04170 [Lachnoclostridium sp. An181]